MCEERERREKKERDMCEERHEKRERESFNKDQKQERSEEKTCIHYFDQTYFF